MSDPVEVWRSIPSAPKYEASSLGRIRSIYFSNRWIKLRPRLRIIAQAVLPNGYHQVTISINNAQRPRLAHRLVCEAFNGPCPDRHECAHGNGMRGDNRPENLRWATKRDNQLDRHLHGTACRGEENSRAKLSSADAICIRARRAAGELCVNIAPDFGVSASLVGKIAGRKIWSWLT